MVTFRDLVNALRDLGLDGTHPIIAHVSLSALGQVQGGAESVLAALVAASDGLIMPTFTYKTMLIPETGPPNNGICYGSKSDANQMAEFFQADIPSDSTMGIAAEMLRQRSEATRSTHPILSFAGINADEAINAQTLAEPLAPIRVLAESRGVVLLLGVDHSVNTSIHYGEKLVGRKQFIRWALTPTGVRQCPNFPGCSMGFQEIAPKLAASIKKSSLGSATIQAIHLIELVQIVGDVIVQDPLALLCSNPKCERCQAVRAAVDPKIS